LPRQIQISVQTGPTSPASGALDWKGPQPPALGPPSVARRLIQFAAAAADSLFTLGETIIRCGGGGQVSELLMIPRPI